MSSAAVCAKVGCNLPVYVEPRTNIVHMYCGRTHALEAMGSSNVQQPHGACQICNLRGCKKTVAFDAMTGRVHDFCCKEHADRAIGAGEWVKPHRYNYHGGDKANATGSTCRFPNCKLPVFIDSSSGREHDYCGRSHAVEHRLMQARVNHSAPIIAHSGLAIVQPSIGQKNAPSTGYASAVPSSTNAADKTAPLKNNFTGFTGFALALDPQSNAHSSSSTDRVYRTGYARAVPMLTSAVDNNHSSVDDANEDRKPAAVPLPKCAICLDMNASIIIIPCGHVCLCKDDAENLRRNQQLLNCPICRVEVNSTHEVFLNH
jgi:hypothetical protein